MRRCRTLVLRSEAGARLGDPVVAVISRLTGAGAPFRAGRPSHDIEGFTTRGRFLYHPQGGDLRLEHHPLRPSDHPELHMVVDTPVQDSPMPAVLAKLLSLPRRRSGRCEGVGIVTQHTALLDSSLSQAT